MAATSGRARTAWCCRCASGESFVTDANRFAQAALYATDNGADVIQEALGTFNGSALRPPGDRVRLRPRRDRDRLSRRRGRRAPQPAGLAAGYDRSQLGHQVLVGDLLAAVVPAAERLHELRDPDDAVGAEQFLLLRGNGQGRGRRRPDLRAAENALRRRQAEHQHGLPARRRLAVRRSPPMRCASCWPRETSASAAPADDGPRAGRRRQLRPAARVLMRAGAGGHVHGSQPADQLRAGPGAGGYRTPAPHHALPGAPGIRRVLRLRPAERLQGGERRRERDDPARGGDHGTRLVPADRSRVNRRSRSAATSAPGVPTAARSTSPPARSRTTPPTSGPSPQAGATVPPPRHKPARRRPCADRHRPAARRLSAEGLHRQRQRRSAAGLKRPPQHAPICLHRPGRCDNRAAGHR